MERSTRMPRAATAALGLAAAAATLVASTITAGPASAAPMEKAVRVPAGAQTVPGSYVVVLKDGMTATSSVSGTSSTLTGQYGGKVTQTYSSALRGFGAKMSAQQARRLAADPRVDFVEQDSIIKLDATQTGATQGLDRIDQRARPLDGSYTFNTTATNVNAYIIDTGIRTTHVDFGGRATRDFDSVGDGQNGNDCNGHGTHVSGTVGGNTWGVAKGVRLHAVRVLDCNGSGTTNGVIAGVNFVTANHGANAVANMSLGGGISTALDNAVRNSITAGVTYGIAAGNSNANACNSSPSRVTQAIIVGATTPSTDVRASFSNFGTCLDLFAPGVNITSAWRTSDTATNTISGTSMATPHVVGVAALWLSAHPGSSPAAVQSAIIAGSTAGVVGSAGTGSPNRMLFSLI